MVLHARVCGSVGSCPVYHKAQPKGWAFVFLPDPKLYWLLKGYGAHLYSDRDLPPFSAH